MKHTGTGNCWVKAYECRRGCGKGELCDVCHDHDKPRGECAMCPQCVGCGPKTSATITKPLLVGECNPYQTDPHLSQRFALYPDPPRCAGWNLCHRIMQLDEGEYLARFDRVNLCDGPWRMKEARVRAAELTLLRPAVSAGDGGLKVVLFGARVCKAFETDFAPFTRLGRFTVLPHPSGLSRAWNEPGAFERARTVLREAGVL